jgi:hypothetical protein
MFIREIVLSVIALGLVWACIDLFRKRNFSEKVGDARQRNSDLLGFTFIVLLTIGVVFLAAGYWLAILFDGSY